ncbi:Phosphatidylglycerol--prolipoprotein diacylglyceryl transferase [Gammaproteobacteria bacterium]
MLTYPSINPIALQLGPFSIHWYGLMYLVGFGAAWWLGRQRAPLCDIQLSQEQVSDIIFWAALGTVFGGRLGYILFYDLPNYLANPVTMLQVWRGGMSFHGGLLGVLTAIWFYQRNHRIGFFRLTDFIAPLVPIGLGAGRIGNFINGELFGRITDLPWAMVFLHGGPLPRHPSQLYEAALEGIVLFLILWIYSRNPRPTMAISGMFLFWYGIFRFLVEFSRQPDPQIGYLAWNWLTMGQLLSFPMVIAGVILLWKGYHPFLSKRSAN